MASDPYVADLLAVLKETKSVDAFLVTLGLLVDAQPDHRQVVPVVIRNAERLGILADHWLTDEAGKRAKIREVVTRAIERLVHRGAAVGCCKDIPGPAGPIPPWVTEAVEAKLNSQADCRQCHGLKQLSRFVIEAKLKPQGNCRTPVLPPIPPGEQPTCDDPPSDQEILRALPERDWGVPGSLEVSRDDIDIQVEKLVDRVDAPRFYPLVGPAQLHHCHWKCTVYYTETVKVGWPFSAQASKRRAETVYIDRDHLHVYSATSDTLKAIPCGMDPAPDVPEKLKQIEEEWRRYWMIDQPKYVTPQPIQDGVGP
jgi:hypothetical protein